MTKKEKDEYINNKGIYRKLYVTDRIPPETWGMIENEEFTEFAKDYYAKLIEIAFGAVEKYLVAHGFPVEIDRKEILTAQIALKTLEGFNSPIAFVYKTWKFDKKRELEAKGDI